MTKVIVTNREITSETADLGYNGLRFQSMGLLIDRKPPFVYYAGQEYEGVNEEEAFASISAEFNRRGGFARVFDVSASGYFNILAELEERGEPVRAFQSPDVTPDLYNGLKSALESLARSHPN
jgi:hypothetical protein